MKEKNEEEDKKKKSIALKASTKEEELNVEDGDNSEKEDELSLITRKFKRFMQGERFGGRRMPTKRDSYRRESYSTRDKRE